MILVTAKVVEEQQLEAKIRAGDGCGKSVSVCEGGEEDDASN